jgi:hypothetical protein
MQQSSTLPLGRLVLFTALSLADLRLTLWLLDVGEGRIAEGNPIASAWLTNYQADGLVIFKTSIIFLVGAIAVLVSLRRPEAGRKILTFACVVVGLVVLYSYRLLMKTIV